MEGKDNKEVRNFKRLAKLKKKLDGNTKKTQRDNVKIANQENKIRGKISFICNIKIKIKG